MNNKLNTLIEKIVSREVSRMIGGGCARVKEIKHFHPSGKPMPNGSHIQRGGYLNECRLNANAYILNEGVHGNQYGLAKYKGGIITFSTDINALELAKNNLINKIKQVVETFKQRLNKDKMIHKVITSFNKETEEEYIGAYSIGHFFKGRYVGDSGEMFNEKSVSVEVNGLSSKSLVRLAEYIAETFRQETVLVKDMNSNKIFLVDCEPSDEPLEKSMECINTET